MKREFFRLGNPIAWGILATIVVVSVFVILGFEDICLSTATNNSDCSPRWIVFLNSKPNEIGDTLAGFAGSLAFVWLIVTVWLQGQELSDTRQVLKEQKEEFQKSNENMAAQRFEVAFFELISTLNSIIASIDVLFNGRKEAGRDCFHAHYSGLSYEIANRIKDEPSEEKIAIEVEKFFLRNGHEFSHYFRFLYNCFRFLSESKEAKPHHGKLLRSLLSDHELAILFYNMKTDAGEKFKIYAIEYDIFDNLRPDILLTDIDRQQLTEIQNASKKRSEG